MAKITFAARSPSLFLFSSSLLSTQNNHTTCYQVLFSSSYSLTRAHTRSLNYLNQSSFLYEPLRNPKPFYSQSSSGGRYPWQSPEGAACVYIQTTETKYPVFIILIIINHSPTFIHSLWCVSNIVGWTLCVFFEMFWSCIWCFWVKFCINLPLSVLYLTPWGCHLV